MRIRGYDNLSILYEIESAVVLALLCKNRNRAGSSTTYLVLQRAFQVRQKASKSPIPRLFTVISLLFSFASAISLTWQEMRIETGLFDLRRQMVDS